MQNPRAASADLVNASRRAALDYIRRVQPPVAAAVEKGSLSAGRVQSPALRLICEREDEIEAFKAQEYWTIEAALNGTSPPSARLAEYRRQGGAVQLVTTPRPMPCARRYCARPAARCASPPSSASSGGAIQPALHGPTLQQEASRNRLQCAAHDDDGPAPYEGVITGDGTVGLITICAPTR